MCCSLAIQRNKDAVARFFEGTHTGHLDVIDETVAEDIVTHGFPGGNPTSRETYKDWFRGFAESFSNMSSEVLATVADAHRVVVHWRVSVDHTGPFAGLPATGRRATFDGVAIYRMRNGLIAETWLFPDTPSLLAQIGDAREAA